MDPRRFTTIAHGWRRFLGPISEAKADRLVAALRLNTDDHVLDVGCGKGEFLTRICVSYGCSGTGVDVNPDFLAVARARAEEENATARVKFLRIDASKHLSKSASPSAAICTGATHALGGFRATLDALYRRLPPGGRIMIADGFWKQKPPREYLEFLGGTEEELFDHQGNRAQLVEAGFVPTYVSESSLEEWDDYEGEYVGSVMDWAMGHPDDEDAAAIVNRIRAWNDAYHAWGRATLGLGWYVGVKPR